MPPWKQALRNLPIGLALALTVAPGGWLWVLVPAARALGPNALVAQTNPTVAEELLQLVMVAALLVFFADLACQVRNNRTARARCQSDPTGRGEVSEGRHLLSCRSRIP